MLLLELPWSVVKKECVLCRWIWTEAGVHPELETMLEIGGFGYPAMAVMNTKKMKYSILRGSFSNDGINEFLR